MVLQRQVGWSGGHAGRVSLARGSSLGSRVRQGQERPGLPVYSPRIMRDMMTVKMGAELFTVSAKETATFFRLTKPKTTVANL